MSKMIYQAIISGVGQFTCDTLAEGMLITFKEGGPADLAEYCFTHSHGQLIADLAIGQTIKLGELSYLITAVGDVATANFRELGHITIRFDGQACAELLGSVHVIGEVPQSLCVGDTIVIMAD